MNNYTMVEIDIFKKVIEDYNNIKNDLDKRINEGYNMNDLYNYIESLKSCNITNVSLDDGFKYIDFNYCDMCISILENNNKIYLGESIEVWNDSDCAYIGTFNNTRELEDIINEYESEIPLF